MITIKNNLVDLIIEGAEVITYNQKSQKMVSEFCSVAVDNKKIVAVGSNIPSQSKLKINAKNLILAPGIIDSQVHFREPGLTHKEDIESGSKAAILGGVTSIFEMPNTNPNTISKIQYDEKIKIAKSKSNCHYAFFIGGSSENIDQLIELEKLPHSPGIKVFLGASFGSLLVDDDQVFEAIMKNGKHRLTIHSEDEKRLKLRRHIAEESKHPRSHHLWRDEESALISTRKSILFAEKHQRQLHMLHISSAEEMIFLKDKKHIASVEILPQYLTLSAPECYERLGTLAQQNPPIRDQRHLPYLWKALQEGTVDVIGSDHAPHTLEEKNKEYPQSPSGFPGVQTLLPIMLNHVHLRNLSFEKLIQLTTENPARIFNLKNKGRIEVGYDADFTLIDPSKKVEIKNSWIASKCAFTPFDGMTVTGWPVYTILNGQIVMNEDQLLIPHQGEALEFNKK